MRRKDDIDCVIKLQQDKTYRWETDFSRVINEYINDDKMQLFWEIYIYIPILNVYEQGQLYETNDTL